MHSPIFLPQEVPHRRLFLSQERLLRLRSDQEKDVALENLKRGLFRKADALLSEPTTEFVITGPRMLERAQQVLIRVAALSLAYLLLERRDYLERAKQELLAVRDYPHWNPSHFLDTAELCVAFAIGLEWLREELSERERDCLQEALLQKGVLPGCEAQEKPEWWVSVSHNWNLVCNGGLAIGALAIADSHPELTARVLGLSVEKMPLALDSFAPDGAWEGGPHYWEYSAWYSALTIDAMLTALGQDFGLSARPGLDRAGLFSIHCIGPSGLYFNYADAQVSVLPQASLFWLGRRYGLQECIEENHRRLERHPEFVHPFDLIWYERRPNDLAEIPRCIRFGRAEVACMRSAWNPQAFFVATKAGSGQTDHAHLDLGSFVLDAGGVRWATDLGPDDYDLPGYWDSGREGARWRYFRLNNMSHSTLVLNDHLQDPLGQTVIAKASFGEDSQHLILDLSAAYSEDAHSVFRGIKVVPEGGVLVQDEVVWLPGAKDHDLRWQMMTDAQLGIQANKAVLSKNGRMLHARIISPPTAIFQSVSAIAGEMELPNPGFRQLIVRANEPVPGARVAVFLSFLEAKVNNVPLSSW
jgi:hypothetical protein